MSAAVTGHRSPHLLRPPPAHTPSRTMLGRGASDPHGILRWPHPCTKRGTVFSWTHLFLTKHHLVVSPRAAHKRTIPRSRLPAPRGSALQARFTLKSKKRTDLVSQFDYLILFLKYTLLI